MRIIIAHPSAATELKSELDATVDAPDAVAARLLADGFARLPDTKPRSASTNNEGA